MDAVQPLRISKNNTPSSSPVKMFGSAISRPLSEIGSTERRRNSPSYNQATKKMIVTTESSPYTENSSPASYAKPSPRDFWSGKDVASPPRFDIENSPAPEASPHISSPKRRPSVERLMQASRVRNSKIFALESKDSYNPSSLPVVERPSANRPLSQSFANNSFTRFDSVKKENNPLRSPLRSVGHKRSESQTTLPILSPTKVAASVPLPASPEKEVRASPSPTKSSLSRTSQFGVSPQDSFGHDSDEGDRAPTPRAGHRQAKSVTFRAEPAEVNEYEEQTPEPSVSVASDREASWDSDEYDEDYSFDRGSSLDADQRDDSFDEDLENADKTPVVLPEDWSRMSPDEARTDLVNEEDDVFNDNDETAQRGVPTMTARVASDGESRPLPPLPAFMRRERSGSGSLSSAAERAAHAPPRINPSPPKRASCSKDEILQMIGKSSSASAQKHTAPLGEEALTVTNLDTGEQREVQVKETEVEDDSIVADLDEFTKAPPRISRESILRNVRNSKYDFEDFGDEEDAEESEMHVGATDITRPSIAELARMDPDQPVPSRETTRDISSTYRDGRLAAAYLDDQDEVQVKEEPMEEDGGFDMNSIPNAPEDMHSRATRSPSRLDDYDRQSSVLRHGNVSPSEDDESVKDASSRYSSLEAPEAQSSMIQTRQVTVEREDGKETLQEAMQLLTVQDYSSSKVPAKQGSLSDGFMLPAYLSTDDFDFGMKDWITPSPPTDTSRDLPILSENKMPRLQPPVEVEKTVVTTTTTTTWSRESEPQVSPPGSPDSVIRHDDDGMVSPIEDTDCASEFRLSEEEAVVPERVASIKTPGGKLKARPSSTPADLEAMAEQRRMMSAEYPVPPIPAEYQQPSDVHGGADDDATSSVYSSEESDKPQEPVQEVEKPHDILDETEKTPKAARRKSRKSGGRMDLSLLDTSAFSIGADEDGLGLNEDFDRISEAQKVSSAPFPPPLFARFDRPGSMQQQQRQNRLLQGPLNSPFKPHHTYSSAGTDVSTRTQKGYLMRQNTKVVVATNRNFSGDSNDTSKSGSTLRGDEASARPMSPTSETSRPSSRSTKKDSSSPRKPSEEQFLKTEPWNGKTRRKSVRNASVQKSVHRNEVAPPLPGQESGLGVVDEDYAVGADSLDGEIGEGVERGRLFVKVVGVKDLDLPLPRNDRVYFQLTLDNGLHCVTTASLELGKNAPVGQEFELVVLNDLEFQLTLTTKLPPRSQPVRPTSRESPMKSPNKSQKGSAFSRLLSSPKKRAEKERQEREAAEAEERRLQEEEERMRMSQAPSAWDRLHDLVNSPDGSFARAYVNLKTHETRCFGRQVTVDVPCYNEWALENDVTVVNSVRSKRGTNSGPVRRPPYIIGQIQLQLLYVPKPKGAVDEDMPKSMSAAVREMKKAGEMNEAAHEGVLSQQGGDCTHWRRRFFRLQGTKLTAYHEHTHQKRAVINLSKASRLVDGKSMLVADPSPSKSGKGRRKSAFAEEDEAYQYVEEGFRMRFANGETIDFYADSRALKEQWMIVLSQVIGKPDASSKAATWTDLVLTRERTSAAAVAGGKLDSAPPTMAGAAGPFSPIKPSVPEVKDFGRPTGLRSSQIPTPGSRSAPTSPLKGPPMRNAPALPRPTPTRPRTPPLSPRRAGRTRDAVKSMIF